MQHFVGPCLRTCLRCLRHYAFSGFIISRRQLVTVTKRLTTFTPGERYNNGSMATSTASTATLVRQLGVVSATALVISNMIGTGIFTTSGFLAGQLGDPALFL